MARSLSVDRRRRVVGAIEGGLSSRAATQRFGVSAASAIRWRAQERREGDIRPKLQAGDRHSQRIEADAELILSAPAAKSDITLSELREQLRARDGRRRHTLALLQAPQDHAQKKSAEPNSAAVR
jgi:transposase